MKIGIVACGAIVREMIAVANDQGWDYQLTAVPAQYHNTPQKIAPAVQKHIDQWANEFALILIGYADCGTLGALDEMVERYDHVVRIAGPHCYEFYGGDEYDQQAEAHLGTFYLTDFLAHHFDKLVWNGLGLDRFPELKDAYFGNYTHLMYLKQLPDQDESQRARAAAEKLGLEYVVADSGLATIRQRMIAAVDACAMQIASPS